MQRQDLPTQTLGYSRGARRAHPWLVFCATSLFFGLCHFVTFFVSGFLATGSHVSVVPPPQPETAIWEATGFPAMQLSYHFHWLNRSVGLFVLNSLAWGMIAGGVVGWIASFLRERQRSTAA
jgi:hypothetical protein